MSEEVLHISDTQIVDVVIDEVFITVYFLGGTSSGELRGGGLSPEMYDIKMQFPDESLALMVRTRLVPWYQESDPVTVVAFDDGSLLLVNQITDLTLRINSPDAI